jgi:hypothetical protein
MAAGNTVICDAVSMWHDNYVYISWFTFLSFAELNTDIFLSTDTHFTLLFTRELRFWNKFLNLLERVLFSKVATQQLQTGAISLPTSRPQRVQFLQDTADIWTLNNALRVLQGEWWTRRVNGPSPITQDTENKFGIAFGLFLSASSERSCSSAAVSWK